MPEKLKQLIAAMHTLLIAKAIRGAMKRKRPDKVSISGMALDKSVGGFYCCPNVKFFEPDNPTKLQVKLESKLYYLLNGKYSKLREAIQGPYTICFISGIHV